MQMFLLKLTKPYSLQHYHLSDSFSTAHPLAQPSWPSWYSWNILASLLSQNFCICLSSCLGYCSPKCQHTQIPHWLQVFTQRSAFQWFLPWPPYLTFQPISTFLNLFLPCLSHKTVDARVEHYCNYALYVILELFFQVILQVMLFICENVL